MTEPHRSRAGHGCQRQPLPVRHHPAGNSTSRRATAHLQHGGLSLRSLQLLLLLLVLLQSSTLLLVITGPPPAQPPPSPDTVATPMPTVPVLPLPEPR
jgi:hypothetical protein